MACIPSTPVPTRLPGRLASAVLALVATASPAQSAREPAAGDAEAAQVLAAEGDTMLMRGGSLSTPVRRDVPLRGGDRIRTGADGRVQLRFADGALISLQPGTDFRIEAWAYDAIRQRSWFELMHGSMRAVSGSIGKRERDDWRLRTPTATIGIRGTEFTVEEVRCPAAGCAPDAEGGLTLAVIAGRVAVVNDAGSIDVPAGSTLRLRDARTVPTLAGVPARRASGGRSGEPATAHAPRSGGAPPADAPPDTDAARAAARSPTSARRATPTATPTPTATATANPTATSSSRRPPAPAARAVPVAAPQGRLVERTEPIPPGSYEPPDSWGAPRR
jgi:hypothetical protein